jgi:hypothetical protein
MTEILFVGCSLELAPPRASCIPSHVKFYLVATLAYYIIMLILKMALGLGKTIRPMVSCNLHS